MPGEKALIFNTDCSRASIVGLIIIQRKWLNIILQWGFAPQRERFWEQMNRKWMYDHSGSGSKNGEVELNCPALWYMEFGTLKKIVGYHILQFPYLEKWIWEMFGLWGDYRALRSPTERHECCRERETGSLFGRVVERFFMLPYTSNKASPWKEAVKGSRKVVGFDIR